MEHRMEMIWDYKDHDGYRDSFNRLAGLVFGINFSEWHRRGYWDDKYVCHSFVDRNEVVANVSVSRMDVILHGERKKAIQIGTVMTHPEYRGKGLSAALMNNVLQKYEPECDLIFLFANSSVHEFYPKYGFVPAPESQFILQVDHLRRTFGQLRKLDIDCTEDMLLVEGLVRSRTGVSRIFGAAENNLGIFMYYALNVFPDCLYYWKEQHSLVVYKQEDGILHLYDAVSLHETNLNELLPVIMDDQTREVHCYFCPDSYSGTVRSMPLDKGESLLFVRPAAELPNTVFRAPLTLQA